MTAQTAGANLLPITAPPVEVPLFFSPFTKESFLLSCRTNSSLCPPANTEFLAFQAFLLFLALAGGEHLSQA